VYLSAIDRPASGTGDRARTRIAANVFALGAVSLVTDISSEMVVAVLPVYLVVGLHLSPAAYGALDGLYTGATALLRIVGGYVADRTQRRKLVAGTGYAVSAVAKLGRLLAGRSAVALGGVIAFDRAGKGLRSAPRDALITLSTPEKGLGRAFGVHQTMDSIGAFLRPLAALGLLALSAQSFDAVFVASLCIATLGVLLLVLFVRDQPRRLQPAHTVSLRAAGRLLHQAPVRRRLGAACRARVMLTGYVALAGVYVLLFGPLTGPVSLVLTLALLGLFYAATDGVLMALAGPVLPEALRTTGIAVIQTGQALCYLASSVLFGLAWQFWGITLACQVSAAAVVVAIVVTAALLRTGARDE